MDEAQTQTRKKKLPCLNSKNFCVPLIFSLATDSVNSASGSDECRKNAGVVGVDLDDGDEAMVMQRKFTQIKIIC